MDKSEMNEAPRTILKRLHYPIEVMLVCVRWYAAYPLSLRQIEEMRAERGGGRRSRHDSSVVDQDAAGARSGVWSAQAASGIELATGRNLLKVNGEWKYLYRAVDSTGHTIDFLLRAHRKLAAARRFFDRAIDRHGVAEKITIDKSGANTAAIVGMRADSGAEIDRSCDRCMSSCPSAFRPDPTAATRAFSEQV